MKIEHTIYIIVRFFGLFKDISTKREVEFCLKEGTNVADLIEAIFKSFPMMKTELYTKDNQLREWVIVLKNGRNINIYNGMNTILANGDILAIFPPTAGG